MLTAKLHELFGFFFTVLVTFSLPQAEKYDVIEANDIYISNKCVKLIPLFHTQVTFVRLNTAKIFGKLIITLIPAGFGKNF